MDPNSTTETFVSIKLTLDTKRWRGVPFYIRAGKLMPKKMTEISIHYKKPVVCTGDICLFPEKDVARNVLAIRVDPKRRHHIAVDGQTTGIQYEIGACPDEFYV